MRAGRMIAICVMLGIGVTLTSAPASAGLFDSSPSTPEVSAKAVAQIERAINEERYADAGKLLDQALLSSGDDPRLTLLAGSLALARGQNQAALTYFKNVDSDPKLGGRALAGEGIALARLGRSGDATTALEAAVKKDPTAWRAWDALGAEYDQHHEWKKAEAAYDHAAENSGSAAIVLNNRGYSYLCQGRLREAISDFVSALQKKPGLAAARNNLRLAIALQGQYNRATEGADSDDRAAILNNVGFAAMMRGDYVKARALFNEAIKVKGKYYALAVANIEMARNLETKQQTGPADADANSP